MLNESTSEVLCNLSGEIILHVQDEPLWPAYNLVFPTVLAAGVAGNIMNLFVLTRPVLHGVTYVYLTGLAVADLLVMEYCSGLIPEPNTTGIHSDRHLKGQKGFIHWHWQFSAVGAVLRFNDHHNLPFHRAFYHAYMELVLTHSFMAASVLIVCFMTFDRYFSVCRPSEYKNYHTRKHAQYSIAFSYVFGFVINIPLAALKIPCTESHNNTSQRTFYSYQENVVVTATNAWRIYLWIGEAAVRILPALTLAVLNCLIITSFRKLARRQRKSRNDIKFRHRSGTTERQNAVRYRVYQEEKRLVHLLTAIIITFFVTMTPAAALSISYSDNHDSYFGFQIFRAIANLLEISNFALNFFIYCLCSKQFRSALTSLFVPPKVVNDDAIEITTRNGTSISR